MSRRHCRGINENHETRRTNCGEVFFQSSKLNGVVLEVHTATHGIEHGFRLFIDLLQHEVFVIALLDGGKLKGELRDRSSGMGDLSGLGTITLYSVDLEF